MIHLCVSKKKALKCWSDYQAKFGCQSLKKKNDEEGIKNLIQLSFSDLIGINNTLKNQSQIISKRVLNLNIILTPEEYVSTVDDKSFLIKFSISHPIRRGS